MGWNNCLKCGEVGDSCQCSEELEADNDADTEPARMENCPNPVFAAVGLAALWGFMYLMCE